MSGPLIPVSGPLTTGSARFPIPSKKAVEISRKFKALQDAFASFLPRIPLSTDLHSYIAALRERGGEDPEVLKAIRSVLAKVQPDLIALDKEIDKLTSPEDKEIVTPKWAHLVDTHKRISSYLAHSVNDSDLALCYRLVADLSKRCDGLAIALEGRTSPEGSITQENQSLLWEQAIGLATEVNRAARRAFSLRESIIPGPHKEKTFEVCREHDSHSLCLNEAVHGLLKKAHGLVRQTLVKGVASDAGSTITDSEKESIAEF